MELSEGEIRPTRHKILGTPGPHFHYDFGDPSMNMGTPQFSSMFIVELEESTIAMNLLGSA